MRSKTHWVVDDKGKKLMGFFVECDNDDSTDKEMNYGFTNEDGLEFYKINTTGMLEESYLYQKIIAPVKMAELAKNRT